MALHLCYANCREIIYTGNNSQVSIIYIQPHFSFLHKHRCLKSKAELFYPNSTRQLLTEGVVDFDHIWHWSRISLQFIYLLPHLNKYWNFIDNSSERMELFLKYLWRFWIWYWWNMIYNLNFGSVCGFKNKRGESPGWPFSPSAPDPGWEARSWWHRLLTPDCHAAWSGACGFPADSSPPWRWPRALVGTTYLREDNKVWIKWRPMEDIVQAWWERSRHCIYSLYNFIAWN